MNQKPEIEIAKVRILITGKVQGVFFRQSAKEQAQFLRLTGWVKNLSDGSVLSEATGYKNSLLEYISWCKTGPSLAQVASIKVEWLEIQDNPLVTNSAFNITG